MTLKRWTRNGCGLLATLMLASCAQLSAQASADQEKESQMAPQAQVPQGGEAAADAVAAQLDRIAEQSTSRPGAPTAEAPSVPQGPQLSPDDWRARVFRLIDSLHTPADMKAVHVSDVLGLALTDRGGSHEAAGVFANGGRYGVWVNALYRETPDKWTVGLSQQAPDGAGTCLFPLNTLGKHLMARGYSGTEGVRRRDGSESALYRSVRTPDGIVFVVEAMVERAGESVCIHRFEIDANTREDEA